MGDQEQHHPAHAALLPRQRPVCQLDGRKPGTADPNIVSDLATLNAGAKGIGVPFRMSECNSYYNGGADGVSDAYCSSLWVVDFLFDCAIGGSVGTTFHGGGNGDGYTPIADSNGAVVE